MLEERRGGWRERKREKERERKKTRDRKNSGKPAIPFGLEDHLEYFYTRPRPALPCLGITSRHVDCDVINDVGGWKILGPTMTLEASGKRNIGSWKNFSILFYLRIQKN